MANETIQTSYTEKTPYEDECCENVPPGDTSASETSKLGVQAEDESGCSFTQLSEEKGPLSDSYTFSTPAPKGVNSGKKEKSRLSGIQSALTPILKYLNIGNNRPSPESLKHVLPTEKCPQSTGESAHHPSSDLSAFPSGKPEGGKSAPVCLLDFEYLPEITLLDVTYDPTVELTTNGSVLCGSAPATPKMCKENNAKPLQTPKLVEKLSLNPNIRADVLSKNKSSPVSTGILERYLPEITLLDVSRDSEPSPVGQISSMIITQETSPSTDMKASKAVSELSEEAESSDTIQNEDLSCTSLQSVKCVRENAVKVSMEVTQEIATDSVVENDKTEEAVDAKPVNITQDLSPTHEMSAECAGLSTSGLECNPSSERVISEWDSESTENPDTVEVVNKELPTRCDTASASEVSQQNSGTNVPENGPSAVVEPPNLSASSDFNSTASVSFPQNKTLDLPTASASSSTEECKSTDETQSATARLPCVVNQNCSAVKESNHHEVQNATFDRCSLQKSSGSTTLGEDTTTSLHLQNNTFDCKRPSQQNATITLSEISSSDGHLNTLDKPSSPKVCSLTISIKDNSSEVHPPEMPKQNATPVAAEPNAIMHENPNGTFEANPVSDSASGSGESEGKDHSESGLPATGGLSDASSHQSVEMENNKGDTFNLDETLDLKADPMITSTPMPNCKIFTCDKERETGKILAAQKKLYGDGPSKPVDQAPSNIVCDRKTFFTQQAPKFLKPPSKVASQLLKNKPGSALPGRPEPVTSGLPMKRQKAQPEPVRSAASQEPQGTTGIPGSYNLRSTTAASKLPSSGLQRPQLSGIPSVVQRAGPGLRPPSARCNAISSSSTEKPCGPTAANAMTRNAQGKKHQLTRGEALPATKRKRTDAVVPAGNTEASACDPTNKTKNLKQPTASQKSLPKSQRNDAALPPAAAETSSCDVPSRGRSIKQPVSSHRAPLTKPQSHGCAKCIVLEGQLKEKSEEIQRLKEELLKYKKQEDC